MSVLHHVPRPGEHRKAARRVAAALTPTISIAAAEDIRLSATIHAPVLITAQSRRLREVCARLIHLNSVCRRGPFTTVASGEENLARRFDAAAEGTLFIDDVTTFDAAAQRTLLALLNASACPPYRRAARVIAGASRRLNHERAGGAFAQDLFYRLNVIHIDLIDSDLAER